MGIFKDFLEIQRELPPLVKDTQGHGYKYPTLNQILDIVIPMCNRRGIALMQVTHPVPSGVGVETVLFNEENEKISSGVLAMPLTTDTSGNIINVGNINKQGNISGQYGAQAYGSALTYARRYSLTSFFGMKAEDDDGYRASQPRQKQAFNVQAAVAAMRDAPDLNALKAVFGNAWKQASAEEKEYLKVTYDEVKAAIEGAAA